MDQISQIASAPFRPLQGSFEPRWRATEWYWFGIAMIAGCGYAAAHLTRGWIPGDDGTLAQSALRVLHGQLPHRDFDEVYTGGLAYYHALAFRIFGVKLVSLRYALFAIFVPWVATIYCIARRFASPAAAAGIVLLCASWTVPAYPAAMPSWYNLFLATFGAAAILRYIETSAYRWLFVAGIFGGLSVAVKIIGLYYVAAVLLWLVYREQNATQGADSGSSRRLSGYSIFVSAGLFVFLFALARLLSSQPGSAELFHFFLPGAVLTGFLLCREWTQPHRAGAPRFGVLAKMAATFALGLFLPLVALSWRYWHSGAMRSLYVGVLARGTSTAVALGAPHPFGAAFSAFALPAIVIICLAMFRKEALWSVYYAIVAIGMVLLLVLARNSFVAGFSIWISAAMLTPLVIIAGTWILAAKPASLQELTETQQEKLFLVLALAAICSLVQFPFPAAIYFNYCAPLTAIAVLAVVNTRRQRSCEMLLAAALAFYIVFAFAFMVPATIYIRGPEPFRLQNDFRPLRLAAGDGIQIQNPGEFVTMAQTVNEHAQGKPILAFACPEVFFLSGRPNPTRNDSVALPDAVRQAIAGNEVSVVVLRVRPYVHDTVPPVELVREVLATFPNSAQIGPYLVRWR